MAVVIIILLLIGIFLLIKIIYTKKIRITNNPYTELNTYEFNFIRTSIGILKSLYITNRVIESNEYLITMSICISNHNKENRISPNRKKILINDLIKLRNILVGISLYRNNQRKLLEDLIKELS